MLVIYSFRHCIVAVGSLPNSRIRGYRRNIDVAPNDTGQDATGLLVVLDLRMRVVYDHIGLNQSVRDLCLHVRGLVDPAGVSRVVYVVDDQVCFRRTRCLLYQTLDGALSIVLRLAKRRTHPSRGSFKGRTHLRMGVVELLVEVVRRRELVRTDRPGELSDQVLPVSFA